MVTRFYEPRLTQAEIEFIDGALKYHSKIYWPEDRDEIERESLAIRLKLNRALDCESPDCNRRRAVLDKYCDQCEVFPLRHAELGYAR